MNQYKLIINRKNVLTTNLFSICSSEQMSSPTNHIRMTNYFVNVALRKSEADFKADYRINKNTFRMLCNLMSESPEFQKDQSGGRAALDVGEAVCSTLRYLGNQVGTYLSAMISYLLNVVIHFFLLEIVLNV